MATWRNGYAEDCKSLYPSSILGVASKKSVVFVSKKSKLIFLHSSVAQLVEQLTVNQLVAGSSPARGAKIILFLMLLNQKIAKSYQILFFVLNLIQSIVLTRNYS